MSRLLEQQDHFFKLLRTTCKLQRQTLLRTIDKSQLKALSEIAHNVIKGSVILSSSDKNRLKKYKKVLSVLGRKSTKRRDKLKVLQSKTTAIVHLLNVVSSRPWRK
jgi:Zn-dependent oligopeptidase